MAVISLAVAVIGAVLAGGAILSRDLFATRPTVGAVAEKTPATPAKPAATPTSTPAAPPAPAPAPKAAVVPATPAAIEALDVQLQGQQLWQMLKREFPDWYASRVKEAARIRTERDEAGMRRFLAEQLVVLRRQNSLHALAASPPKLKQMAQAFHDNLIGLAKHSTEACFGFISQGELNAIVLGLMPSAAHSAHLNAQLVSVFEAIIDGRRAPKTYRAPAAADYQVLEKQLLARGWPPSDLRLFEDAQALMQTPPQKVCKMVQDWFAAQLAVPDAEVQIRLLVEALRPVVAG